MRRSLDQMLSLLGYRRRLAPLLENLLYKYEFALERPISVGDAFLSQDEQTLLDLIDGYVAVEPFSEGTIDRSGNLGEVLGLARIALRSELQSGSKPLFGFA